MNTEQKTVYLMKLIYAEHYFLPNATLNSRLWHNSFPGCHIAYLLLCLFLPCLSTHSFHTVPPPKSCGRIIMLHNSWVTATSFVKHWAMVSWNAEFIHKPVNQGGLIWRCWDEGVIFLCYHSNAMKSYNPSLCYYSNIMTSCNSSLCY